MPFELDDVELASRLVALGFPGDHAHFSDARSQALARWRADDAFRRLAAAVARGLGVALYDVTADGDVILTAEDGTPFTPRVEDLLPDNVRNDARRRQLAVLALIAAIAEVFPTEEALAGGDPAREFTAEDVVDLLVTRAAAVATEPAAGPVDATEAERSLARAFALVREVQSSVPTATGREAATSLAGIVGSVLGALAEMRLLRAVDQGIGRRAYRPTSALLPHVRFLLERGSVRGILETLRGARPATSAVEG